MKPESKGGISMRGNDVHRGEQHIPMPCGARIVAFMESEGRAGRLEPRNEREGLGKVDSCESKQ